MAATISVHDILSGQVPALLLAHVAVSPVVYPYSLLAFQEADWLGYVPGACVPNNQVNDPSGYLFNTFSVFFPNYEDAPQPVSDIWIDARINEQIQLVLVADQPLGGWPAVPPGGALYYLGLQGGQVS